MAQYEIKLWTQIPDTKPTQWLKRMYASVKATQPDVAIKRVLGGGEDRGYTFATVSDAQRVKLGTGQRLVVECKRIK